MLFFGVQTLGAGVTRDEETSLEQISRQKNSGTNSVSTLVLVYKYSTLLIWKHSCEWNQTYTVLVPVIYKQRLTCTCLVCSSCNKFFKYEFCVGLRTLFKMNRVMKIIKVWIVVNWKFKLNQHLRLCRSLISRLTFLVDKSNINRVGG